MIAEFLIYASAATTPYHLFLIVAAVIIGIVLGALPGLSSTFSCAVMLPLTFTMEPTTALIFLGAVYMSSTYGGSYGAILLNAPGTPQSITTTFDGFPMVKRGDGDLAMSLACLSSIIGGIFGIAALIFIAPPLAKIALSFGPPEFFWLAIFGLTIIASLSEGSLLKGLASGLFGVLLSMVGTAVVSGDTRFTFGQPALVGGITIVPATIGMLCLPVVIDMVGSPAKHIEVPDSKKRSFRLYEAFQILTSGKINIARSSVLGIFIGILPAAGGAIASLVAYSAAFRSSKKPELFRNGNPEGVIASESANNASVGSSLIPTFVLGIPGTPADAVILGAMLIQGLQIGPSLFSNQADIVWTFVAGLVCATILMFPLGMLMGIYAYKFILTFPKTLLVPLITSMILIGAFAIENNYFDVILTVLLGIFAWTIGKFGFSSAPIVLGLLLGPIAERGYSQSLLIGRATDNVFQMFFGRPICLVIITCILLSLFLPQLISFFMKKRKTHEFI